MLLTIVGLSAVWPLAGDIRTGGNVAVTAEVMDSGGTQNRGGAIVNDGSLGGVGGQEGSSLGWKSSEA